MDFVTPYVDALDGGGAVDVNRANRAGGSLS